MEAPAAACCVSLPKALQCPRAKTNARAPLSVFDIHP